MSAHERYGACSTDAHSRPRDDDDVDVDDGVDVKAPVLVDPHDGDCVAPLYFGKDQADAWAGVAVLSLAVGVTIYSLPVWDEDITDVFSDGQWSAISTVSTVAQCLLIIPGAAVDRLGPEYGPRTVATVSAVALTVVYVLMSLVLVFDGAAGRARAFAPLLALTACAGLAAAGVMVAVLQLVGARTADGVKGRTYGVLLAACSFGSSWYAVMTTTWSTGPSGASAASVALRRIPGAAAAAVLCRGLGAPTEPRSPATDASPPRVWWPHALVALAVGVALCSQHGYVNNLLGVTFVDLKKVCTKVMMYGTLAFWLVMIARSACAVVAGCGAPPAPAPKAEAPPEQPAAAGGCDWAAALRAPHFAVLLALVFLIAGAAQPVAVYMYDLMFVKQADCPHCLVTPWTPAYVGGEAVGRLAVGALFDALPQKWRAAVPAACCALAMGASLLALAAAHGGGLRTIDGAGHTVDDDYYDENSVFSLAAFFVGGAAGGIVALVPALADAWFGHWRGGGGALSFGAITGTAYLALAAGQLFWANVLGSAATASAACADRTADAACYTPWLWAGAAGCFLVALPLCGVLHRLHGRVQGAPATAPESGTGATAAAIHSV